MPSADARRRRGGPAARPRGRAPDPLETARMARPTLAASSLFASRALFCSASRISRSIRSRALGRPVYAEVYSIESDLETGQETGHGMGADAVGVRRFIGWCESGREGRSRRACPPRAPRCTSLAPHDFEGPRATDWSTTGRAAGARQPARDTSTLLRTVRARRAGRAWSPTRWRPSTTRSSAPGWHGSAAAHSSAGRSRASARASGCPTRARLLHDRRLRGEPDSRAGRAGRAFPAVRRGGLARRAARLLRLGPGTRLVREDRPHGRAGRARRAPRGERRATAPRRGGARAQIARDRARRRGALPGRGHGRHHGHRRDGPAAPMADLCAARGAVDARRRGMGRPRAPVRALPRTWPASSAPTQSPGTRTRRCPCRWARACSSCATAATPTRLLGAHAYVPDASRHGRPVSTHAPVVAPLHRAEGVPDAGRSSGRAGLASDRRQAGGDGGPSPRAFARAVGDRERYSRCPSCASATSTHSPRDERARARRSRARAGPGYPTCGCRTSARWLRACITHADVGPADVRALVEALGRARTRLAAA